MPVVPQTAVYDGISSAQSTLPAGADLARTLIG